MAKDIVQSVPSVEDRVRFFQDAAKRLFPDFEKQTELPTMLFASDWDQDDVAQNEEFIRQILQALRAAHPLRFERLEASCTTGQADLLKSFIRGDSLEDVVANFDFDSTRGSRQEFGLLKDAKTEHLEGGDQRTDANQGGIIPRLRNWISSLNCFGPRKVDLGLWEDMNKKQPLLAYVDAKFSNWGRTVQNTPRYTFVPTTRYGVQEIVRYAKFHDLSVRVSGYRHSWSPQFARDKHSILISMLDLERASAEVNTESLGGVSTKWFGEASTELNKITNLGKWETDPNKTLVRVGCATTNEQVRRWCIQNGTLTLPLNVIMVEITFGGSNAPICHGAGIKHRTLSDLVEAIEYIDVNGEYRHITSKDGNFLSAASGCFGLIGVITHVVLRLDPMSYAQLEPTKMDVIDAIPPPAGMRNKIPKGLYKHRTPEQIAAAQMEFERRASSDYYAEWFWFPFADQVWINTWTTTDDSSNVQAHYPTKIKIVKQWLEAIAIEALQNIAKATNTQDWAPLLRTTAISRLAMSSLPGSEERVKAYLPDALHFRRAIQNTRVRDMELEIPLPRSQNQPNKPDFEAVQTAWWQAILRCYEHSKTCPMRMPLELRIMGDSDVIMAPQRNNTLGTASIEVLTLEDISEDWHAFAQEVCDDWMSLRSTFKGPDGGKLNIRPHWAKEWYNFTVDGKPMLEYLKTDCYPKEINDFNAILNKIGKRDGWTREEIQKRFSNDLFDELFFADLA